MTDAQDVADQMKALHERITRLIDYCRAEAKRLPHSMEEPQQLELFTETED